MNVAGVCNGSDVRNDQVNVRVVSGFSGADAIARSKRCGHGRDVGSFCSQSVGDGSRAVAVAVGSDDDRA